MEEFALNQLNNQIKLNPNSKYGFQSRKLLMRPKLSHQDSSQNTVQALQNQNNLITNLPQPQNKIRMSTAYNFFQKERNGDAMKFALNQRTPSQKLIVRPNLGLQRKDNNIHVYITAKEKEILKNDIVQGVPSNNTLDSTKVTRTQNSMSSSTKISRQSFQQNQLMDKKKLQQFVQEDEEEELQFMLLCQTLEAAKKSL